MKLSRTIPESTVIADADDFCRGGNLRLVLPAWFQVYSGAHTTCIARYGPNVAVRALPVLTIFLPYVHDEVASALRFSALFDNVAEHKTGHGNLVT